MPKKIVKMFVITGLVLGLVFLGYFFYFLYLIDIYNKNYSEQELVESFNDKRTEIASLRQYYNSIIPKSTWIEIEFENNNELARFGIASIDSSGTNFRRQFLDWHMKINTPEMETLLSSIGWNMATLKTLKQKLDDANCIQIESGQPTRIGFKRSGMGIYSFNVFDSPMTDSVKSLYSSDCAYIIANDKLVLEYGGGAIGSQCFPK